MVASHPRPKILRYFIRMCPVPKKSLRFDDKEQRLFDALLSSMIHSCHSFFIYKQDYDPRRLNTRLSWELHLQSCIHIGNFELYYKMTPSNFEFMFQEIGGALECCPIKASNATPMGHIEARVKLACCLRILYGEAPKSLAQIFHVSLPSVNAAFRKGMKAINGHTAFDLEATTLTNSQIAAGFANRSNYPGVCLCNFLCASASCSWFSTFRRVCALRWCN